VERVNGGGGPIRAATHAWHAYLANGLGPTRGERPSSTVRDNAAADRLEIARERLAAALEAKLCSRELIELEGGGRERRVEQEAWRGGMA
jgi:hypothetical protein